MAASSPTELPAYIQLRWQETGVFSRLKSEAADVSSAVRRNFDDMAKSLDASITRSIRSGKMGSRVDLGVGGMREAIAAQNQLAATYEATARAARRASEAEGGNNLALRQAAEAAEDKAAKTRAAAAMAMEHADALAKVQAQLLREASSTRSLGAANDNAAASSRAHRGAMIGLGQQLQDTVIQAQMGVSALTIFAQQGSQAAFQMSNMGGKVGAVASVMAGPWGAAVFAGTALLGPLISGLFQTSQAMDDVRFATDAMRDAQGILGSVMDMTTGRINTQRGELLALAQAQILVNRVQAEARAAEARRGVQDIQSRPLRFTGGGLGGGFSAGRRPVDARDTIAQQVLDQAIDPKVAVERLENLRKAGVLTTEEFTKAASAVANLGLELANIETFSKADALLNGEGGIDLLKPAKPKKDRSAEKAQREAERLRKAGESAAEAVARINERFDQSPRLIDQAARATRELDAVIADLSRRDPVKFRETIAQAQAAKQVVTDALLRPIQDMRDASEQRLTLQDLLAEGRDNEAAALQAIWSLEQKLGDEDELRVKVQDLITEGRQEEARVLQTLLDMYPAMKREAADLAVIEAQRTREAERQQALFEAQVDVINTARNSMADLFSGRSTDFLGGLKQSLRDLQGARIADQLFGDMFAEIEDQLRQRSPLGRATSRLTSSVDEASTGADHLATATETAAQRILAASRAIAVNDNGYIDGATGEIVVTREKNDPVRLARYSVNELADLTAHGIVDPLLAGFGDIFGTRFFQGLSATMSGLLAGTLTGGVPGGILGGLRGAVFDYGPDVFGKGMTDKLLGKFDKAMGGAATGSMVAGVGNSLGLRLSGTGSQIGGAIGSLIPIPGMDIVGSIAGGLLGSLFGKTKWGRVDLSALGASASRGNSGSSEEAAVAAGGSFYEGLQGVIDQLGGTMGDFGSIALGVRHGDWRVNTGSQSLKVKKGAKDFNEDQAAALEYAIKAAIDRGAVKGIRDSSQRLLRAGQDLDKALQDALDWENAFRELKQYKDPLGAALDDLDKEFERYIDLAKKAGASQQEMADLQELYGIKQAEVIEQANERILGSLQGLLDDLTIGDSGLSLRTREENALARYQPLADRVAAGDQTAYDDYAEAAQALLDIERQLYGSQKEYFDRLNEVTALTRNRIDAETNVVSIAENRDSPFDSSGKVRDSIESQTNVLSGQLEAANINAGRTNALLERIEKRLADLKAAPERLASVANF